MNIAKTVAYVPMSDEMRSEADEYNALVREALDNAWRAAEEERRLTELYGPVLKPGRQEWWDTPMQQRLRVIEEISDLMDEYGLTLDDLKEAP